MLDIYTTKCIFTCVFFENSEKNIDFYGCCVKLVSEALCKHQTYFDKDFIYFYGTTQQGVAKIHMCTDGLCANKLKVSQRYQDDFAEQKTCIWERSLKTCGILLSSFMSCEFSWWKVGKIAPKFKFTILLIDSTQKAFYS